MLSTVISSIRASLPSDVRPFRLAGGRVEVVDLFHCSPSRLGDLIQVSDFGLACSVSSYSIDVFFFIPLSAAQVLPIYTGFSVSPSLLIHPNILCFSARDVSDLEPIVSKP